MLKAELRRTAFASPKPNGILFFLFFFVLSFCTSCVSEHYIYSSRAVFQPEIRQALQESLDASIRDLDVPGAVMLIQSPEGAEWLGASGISRILEADASAETAASEDQPWPGPAMEPDMHFRIASNTKTFTASVILQLASEERLSLDQTVADWLGDVVPGSRIITIRQLLNMTSGLKDYVDGNFLKESIFNPLQRYSPEELLRRISTAEPIFAPGSDWQYCNTNYLLLGMIIEKVTGNSFQREVRDRIVSPLGLSNTYVPAPDEVEISAPYAHGYFFLGDASTDWKDMAVQNVTGPWAAGNMVSTARDMLKWLNALCSCTLLSEPQCKEMFTWVGTKGSGNLRQQEFQYYGLGVMKYNGAIGHKGSLPGYRSAILRYQGYSFVVLLNGFETMASYRGFERHHALYVFDKAAAILELR
jgi:CubicO group peptidase (beta-lactamase class C family)